MRASGRAPRPGDARQQVPGQRPRRPAAAGEAQAAAPGPAAVLALQRAVGNAAVARMLSDDLTVQRMGNCFSSPSQQEQEAAPPRASQGGRSGPRGQHSRRQHRHSGQAQEETRAEASGSRGGQARQPQGSERARGKAPAGASGSQGATPPARAATPVKELTIHGGTGGPVTVRSASDLLAWLMGNPSRPVLRDWADPDLLKQVLARLEQQGGPVRREAVWRAVQDAEAAGRAQHRTTDDISEGESERGGFFRPPSERSERSEEPEITSATAPAPEVGAGWPAGEWGQDEARQPTVPLEFQRDMSGEEAARRQADLDRRLSGYRLVGFHGTYAESVANLVTDGVDASLMGSRNGAGKGPGFYVVPVVGPHGESGPGTGAAKKSARHWGPFLVAVYVRRGVEVVTAGQDDVFDRDDAGPSASGPAMEYHHDDELVIPVSLFSSVRLVRNPEDVTMARDLNTRASPYRDGVSAFSKAAGKAKASGSR